MNIIEVLIVSIQAVIRSCEKMRHLNQLDSRIQLCIATDQPHEKSFLHLGLSVISTPASFRPKKALYKARALEWFRLQVQLYDDDWVLHLDEETVIDDHTVKACLQFAEMEISLDFGQVQHSRLHNIKLLTLPYRESSCTIHSNIGITFWSQERTYAAAETTWANFILHIVVSTSLFSVSMAHSF